MYPFECIFNYLCHHKTTPKAEVTDSNSVGCAIFPRQTIAGSTPKMGALGLLIIGLPVASGHTGR